MFQTVVDEYEVFAGFISQENTVFYSVGSCMFPYSVSDNNSEDICTEPSFYLKKYYSDY